MKCVEVDTHACFTGASMLLFTEVQYGFVQNFFCLVIHSCFFFPKVAVKIIDKTQLNPTSLQKVRVDCNIGNSVNS